MAIDVTDNAVAVAYRLRQVLIDHLADQLATLEASEPFASAGITLPDVDAVYAMDAGPDAMRHTAFIAIFLLSSEYDPGVAGNEQYVQEDYQVSVFLAESHLGGTSDDSLWRSASYVYCLAAAATLEAHARDDGAAESLDRLDIVDVTPDPETIPDRNQDPWVRVTDATVRVYRRTIIL